MTVTWDAVDGANKYYVYLLRNDGTGFYTQSGFARTINASAERKTVYGAAAFATPDVSGIDDWMVEVYAVNAVGEYIRSDKSNSFSVNMPKLTTPTPTLDSSGQASWSTISGANNYGFTLYGRSGSSGSGSQIITGSTNRTSTDLSGHMAEGYSYRIRVYAFDSTYTHINSDIAYSGWVAYKPAKAPVVSEVTSVAAVVTAPTAGKTPSEVKPILSTEDVTLYDYDWKDQNGNTLSKWYDTFESGKTYRLVVLASTTKKFASNATAAVNGQAATVDNRSDSTLRFYFDFTLDTTIDTVNFNVPSFYVGDTPQDISVTTVGTQHFTVRGVTVTDDNDNPLASDHKFADREKVYIYIELEADDGYAFPSDYKKLNSYFSGEAGQEWPYTDVKNVTVYMAYRVGARPTISNVDVTLAEPVAGAKPSTTAAAADNRYTVSRVVWYHLNGNGTSGDELGSNETFEAGKGYTVMIVAKANMGYWFSVTSSTVNGKSATTAYTRDDTYACYYNFPAQQTKTLASIAVTTPPTKTEYIVGNSFDATGMVVTATYSDGSSAPVTGYAISPNGSLTEGHKSVTVSYTENYITKTATQAITVKPATKTLESIAITKAPTKTEYRTGDTFDAAGMIVTATYTDKTTAAVTGYTFTPNGKLAANNTTVTVSYTEGSVTKTATQAITVKQAKTPSSLAVTTAPTKTTYAAGEMFSSSGMVVTVTYTDNSTAAVTGYTVTPSGKLAESDKSVTISYTENEKTVYAVQAITVTAAKPNVFTDVKESAYYYDAVQWAYYTEPQVTNGVGGGKFGPDTTCTRAQVMTFLWRAAGCPAPKNPNSPFVDVAPDTWYTEAVLWAVEQGITNGIGNNKFGPELTCSRSQVITMLYRAAGEPSKTGTGTWYDDAVNWANSNGLLSGTAEVFTPEADCPRKDIVLYLYRQLAK